MVALPGGIRISEELLGALDDAAAERRISRSEAIREAIGQWVLRQAAR